MNAAIWPSLPQTSSDATPAARPARLRLRLTAAAESRIRRGHPWVFSDSIREQNRPGKTGELAAFYDRRDRLFALGWFDADSPIRARILHRGGPALIDGAWWLQRLRESVERRRGLIDAATTGCRLIHGESDGFPGLVLDRYGDTLVAKLYFAAWLPAWPAFAELAFAELAPRRLILRLSRNLEAPAALAGFTDGTTARGDSDLGPAEFLESGLRFVADVQAGQKTGFFLDQRENRRWVETVAAGAEALNLFSFSGGFSLYAARGGATTVVDVDLSAHALDAGARNFALNRSHPRIAAVHREAIQANAFEWLADGPRRQFDVVVVDPPSLARREAERTGAIEAYERLVSGALERTRTGGRLLAASCSAHVSETEFIDAVLRVAQRSGRRHAVEGVAGQPADHSATFPEALYLKAVRLRLD